MTSITQCPDCSTRFKVTDAQLDAHDGLVRCGHCHEVFNARAHLHSSEPSPQLRLPIEPEAPSATTVPGVPELREEPGTLAQQVQFIDELTDEVPPTSPPKSSWLGVLLVVVLMLALLAQAAYVFRVSLAARLPGLKPALAQYCELLDCAVPLPQRADLVAIESSELESDPAQGNLVTLHALIHNRAPYTQAYPSLELTLTDLEDKPVARRVFGPPDYLKNKADGQQGVPANRDLEVKLRLDTTDLKPSGYRLFLFYPR